MKVELREELTKNSWKIIDFSKDNIQRFQKNLTKSRRERITREEMMLMNIVKNLTTLCKRLKNTKKCSTSFTKKIKKWTLKLSTLNRIPLIFSKLLSKEDKDLQSRITQNSSGQWKLKNTKLANLPTRFTNMKKSLTIWIIITKAKLPTVKILNSSSNLKMHNLPIWGTKCSKQKIVLN